MAKGEIRAEASPKESSKSKKRKEESKANAKTEAGSSDLQSEVDKTQKKKKKKKAAVSDVVATPVTEGSPVPVKKNRKRRRADSESATAFPDHPVEENAQPKKKKHKKSSKIANPTKDKSLSEPALRALVYAYTQYRNPEEWKFSKARQNWLIRHIWSSNMIPDEHLPLVTWYLKSVKGGIRDSLLKTCHSYLQIPLASQDETKDEEITNQPLSAPLFGLPPKVVEGPSDNAQETKKLRAQIVLAALEAP